jgi:anaerobic selenocysteine-containing dehydrogenase
MTTTSRRDFLKIATAGAAGAAFAPQASSRDFPHRPSGS